MKHVLALAICLLPTTAQAHDPYTVDRVLGIISDIAHHAHPDYVGGPPPLPPEGPPPPEEDLPPAPPVANSNLGSPTLRWLRRQGIRDAFITGRRDLDCRQVGSRGFVGGVGIMIKRGNRPESGVVCISANNTYMEMDH